MINPYDLIPKDMLDNAVNPNFDKHHIKIPFRMCVSAPSGSGKTSFIFNLIKLFSEGQGTFNDITVCTRNKDEPIYNYLAKIAPKIEIKEGQKSLPILDKMNKKLNHLVIVDDLLLDKDQTSIINYYIRCRKRNCSIVYISQSFYDIPRMIRNNINYLIVKQVSSMRNLTMIMRECSLGITKEALTNMYKEATKEKKNFMLIDLEEGDPLKRFRFNFDSYFELSEADFK
jgi:Ni2+-binding GTPase involved in maturation of urease and hydrogenase